MMTRWLPEFDLRERMGHLSRRSWLQLGTLVGSTALGLDWRRRAAAGESRVAGAASAGFGRAKSVILLVAGGGQSQIDTWDPKPHAPLEVRGEFDSIATRIPGERFCEHLPLTAQTADRLCVVRSMSHEDLDHGSALYLTLTGHYHRKRSANPLPSPDDLPCLGAALTRVRPSHHFVQTAVHLNGPVLAPIEPAPGQYSGFLGPAYAPMLLGDVSLDRLAIPGLEPQTELSESRLDERGRLLRQLDGVVSHTRTGVREAVDAYQRAFDLLDRPASRQAFDLGRERPELREAYGRNRTGQSCLLARRLVEAGCPLVTVFLNHNVRGQDLAADAVDEWGWDTHNDIFEGLEKWLLPRFDRAYSTLIRDLDQRGLLAETLVVCLGEFGRAPLVALEPRFAGATPGRKHWGAVYSIVFAGAGVRPGTIVGASDAQGGYPDSAAYGPWDTLATIFSSLGVDPQQEYQDASGRPYRLCDGRVIEALYRG